MFAEKVTKLSRPLWRRIQISLFFNLSRENNEVDSSLMAERLWSMLPGAVISDFCKFVPVVRNLVSINGGIEEIEKLCALDT